jgi:probable F420-dependent oxidoreductase
MEPTVRERWAGRLGPWGVWSRQLRFCDEPLAARRAAEIEGIGCSAAWLPGGDPGVAQRVEVLLAATERLVVAIGVASIWEHDAGQLAADLSKIEARHPGRLLLGVGTSHRELVDSAGSARYRNPMRAMSSYLDVLDQPTDGWPAGRRVLGALGPKMLSVARERSAGTHPYLVSPDHTLACREELGADHVVAPHQAVVLEVDRDRARNLARAHVQHHFKWRNYVQNMRRMGFSDDDLAGGGSDRLVDALVAWGRQEAVARRVREHLDAGADHVAIQVLPGPDDAERVDSWTALAAAMA